MPQELLDNPLEYCKEEYINGITKRNEMVIIGCSKDEGNDIIIDADIPKWSGNQELKYLIRIENILGYIDFNYRR